MTSSRLFSFAAALAMTLGTTVRAGYIQAGDPLPGGGSVTTFVETPTDFLMVITGGKVTGKSTTTFTIDGDWKGFFQVDALDPTTLFVEGTPTANGKATNGTLIHNTNPHAGETLPDTPFEFLEGLIPTASPPDTATIPHPGPEGHSDVYSAAIAGTGTIDTGILSYTFTLTAHHVPEPGSSVILGIGLGLVGIARWGRRKRGVARTR